MKSPAYNPGLARMPMHTPTHTRTHEITVPQGR